jgi:hypothetical protein
MHCAGGDAGARFPYDYGLWDRGRAGPFRQQNPTAGRATGDRGAGSRGAAKVEIRRVEVVGARVSGELFRNGLLATALALFARIRENLAKFQTMPLR